MKKNWIFTILIAACTTLFSSCIYRLFDFDDEGGVMYFVNMTNDTIYVPTTRYNNPVTIRPGDTAELSNGMAEDWTFVDCLRYFNFNDTLRVYCHDSLLIQWNPPLRDMGDTNSFYNPNSWINKDKHDGANRHWYKSYLIITESDFGANY